MKLQQWSDLVNKNPRISSWVGRHPRVVRFVKNRLARNSFFGLPTTLSVLVGLFCLFVFGGIVQDYLARDPLIAIDVRLANLLFAFRTREGLRVMYGLTLVAAPAVILLGLGTTSMVLFLRKQWRLAIVLIGGLVATEAFTFAAKILFHRNRPGGILQAIVEDSFSFPSGHATSAAFFFCIMTYLFIRSVKGKFWLKFCAVITGLSFIVIIDVSRLYLGVHYLSDVVAGNMVGFLGVLATAWVTGWLRDRKVLPTCPPKVIVLAITSGLIVSALSAVAWFHFGASPWTTSIPENKTSIAADTVPSLFSNQKLPSYSESLSGNPMEPVSLILVVPSSCLTQDFSDSGWTLADGIFPRSIWDVAKAALLNDEYLSAPITPSFFNERPHDFGFEKATEKESVRSRHHARFWKTDYTTPDGDVFVGTASLDTGLKWGVTHSIAPDIDTERDLLVSDLKQSGLVVSENVIDHFVAPTLGQNLTGDQYFTNGSATFLVMRCH